MEDNVGDGRVSGEYDNWPYRAEYNLDEESDDEEFGRGWEYCVEIIAGVEGHVIQEVTIVHAMMLWKIMLVMAVYLVSTTIGLAEVGNGTRCWTTKHKVAVSLAV